MANKSKILAAACAALLASGCASKDGQDGSSLDSQESALESGLTALGGTMDDNTSGSSFGMNSRTKAVSVATLLRSGLLPDAWAASCTRAAAASCSSGTKTVSYNSCTGFGGLVSFTGNVTLTWSNTTDCTLDNSESVTRTYSTTLTGPRGGTLTLSSANHTNYEGTLLGGGGRITQNSASSWDVEILGKQKILTSANGRTLFNISAKTTSPIAVSGSLGRAGRTVNGGALAVYHNQARFTATYVPSNLTYSSTCCHPTGGSMSVTYTGTVTGSGSISFGGCGIATITKDGQSQAVTLSYCE